MSDRVGEHGGHERYARHEPQGKSDQPDECKPNHNGASFPQAGGHAKSSPDDGTVEWLTPPKGQPALGPRSAARHGETERTAAAERSVSICTVDGLPCRFSVEGCQLRAECRHAAGSGGREAEAAGDDTVDQASDSWQYRYRVIRKIGQGGFAEVYLAADEQLGRLVALKMPRRRVELDAEKIDRLLAEARAAARLDHPNVVTVYDFGRHCDTAYISYAYCDGPTLKQWVGQRGAPVPAELAGRVMLQLCDAVAHAHSRGVLHCDLKPGNILLEPQGDESAGACDRWPGGLPYVPRITDFGLARFALDPAAAELGSSRDGPICGTLAYMAPEQAAGKIKQINAATDVYGLGTILYELLTGVPPFVVRPELRLPVLLERVRAGLIVPPREIRPELTRDIEAICMRCLQREQADRYGSATELADDLRRWFEGYPVEARPVHAGRRLMLWSLRHPTVTAVLALMFVGLITAVSSLLLHNRVLSAVNAQLRAAARSAEAARTRSDADRLELLNQLYADDMSRAMAAWQRGDTYQYAALLDKYASGSGAGHCRTIAWALLRGLSQVQRREALFERNQYFAAFSHGGDRLAVAGASGTVRVLALPSLKELLRFEAGQGEVNCVQFSPDDRTLVTAGDDGTLCWWQSASGRRVRCVQAHPGELAFWSLFSPDGRCIITCGTDRAVRVWEAATGRQIGQMEHADGVEAIALSPDGRWLVTAPRDLDLMVWDVRERKEAMRVFLYEGGRPTAVAFAPDGHHVACGTIDGGVVVADVETRQRVAAWRIVDRVQALAFDPAGKELAISDRNGNIHIWDLGEGYDAEPRLVRSWPAHRGRVYSIQFHNSKRMIVSAGEDGAVRLWSGWNASNRRRICVEASEPGGPAGAAVQSIAAVPGSRLVFAATWDGPPALWDVATGERWATLPADCSHWIKAAASADGTLVAALTADGQLVVWSVKGRRPVFEHKLATKKQFDPGRCSLQFSCDGSKLAVSLMRNEPVELYLFDLIKGRRLPFDGTVHCDALAFAPRGGPHGLAIAVEDQIWLYDTDTLARTAIWFGHTSGLRDLAFSPDGRWLAGSDGDRHLLLWDVADPSKARRLLGHFDTIETLVFTPDSLAIVTGGSRGELCIWDVRTGRLTLRMQRLDSPIRALAVTSDQRHVLALCGRLANGKYRPGLVTVFDAAPMGE